MDAVALAATVGGSLVALAGVGATAWSARQQRESAKELAKEQHAHERRQASGERLFERRASVYESMISWLQRTVESMDEDVRNAEATRRSPDAAVTRLTELPTTDERRTMTTRLRTFGSPAIADAYDGFVQSMDAFFQYFFTASGAFTADLAGPDAVEDAWNYMRPAFEQARADLGTIERLVSDELAAL
jgi:hypothetical protein